MTPSFTVRQHSNDWKPKRPTWAAQHSIQTFTFGLPPFEAEKMMKHGRAVAAVGAVIICARAGDKSIILSADISEDFNTNKVRPVDALMAATRTLSHHLRPEVKGLYLFHYNDARRHLSSLPDLTLYRFLPKLLRLKPHLVDDVFGTRAKQIRVFDLLQIR